MQEYRKILEDETLAESLNPMNRNWETILSQSSGTSFPKVNLVNGQSFYNTQEKCLYTLVDAKTEAWRIVADFTKTYVTKEYADTMHIPLSRVDDLITANKIKMSLLDTGNTTNKLVLVGNGDKIATSLIDTGTTAGKIVKVGDDGKIPNGLLNVGIVSGTIPVLGTGGKLPNSVLPLSTTTNFNAIAIFDTSGKLVFPNGSKVWIE